jgi:hypothetical protein
MPLFTIARPAAGEERYFINAKPASGSFVVVAIPAEKLQDHLGFPPEGRDW